MFEQAQRRRIVPARWPKKLLFSVITTIGFFLLLEGMMFLTGVEPEAESRDPLLGFSSHMRLMEVVPAADGQALVSTAPNKLAWFNIQTFPKQKSSGTRRVFCLGGSTTFGRPYSDPTSYAGWLRELLPLADSTRRWEVINAGGVSYASYRVAVVMEELTEYDPDLFIVYTGHNEFLERRTYEGMFEKSQLGFRFGAALSRLRTWSLLDRLVHRSRASAPQAPTEILPAEVDEMLNHTVGPADYHRDDDWRDKVLQHYELNLSRMVTIARQAGAQIVFITPAANQKDCSPFKSELDPNLGEKEAQEFRTLFERAEHWSQNDQPEQALAGYRQALRIDGRYAELHYRIGRILLRLGRLEDAHAAFRRALNEDVCPLRAVDEIFESIQRVARRENVSVVDFRSQLLAACRRDASHESLGDEYFLDHVHLNIATHRQLALWIIEDLQRTGIAGDGELSDAMIEEVSGRVYAKIDKTSQRVALRNLAKVLHWAGKFREASLRAEDALELFPNDTESRFVLADCLRHLGFGVESAAEFERILEVDPDYSRAYIPFGQLLAEQGKLKEAKIFLTMGCVLRPDRADALYSLGVVHVELGEFDLALEALQMANELVPNDPDLLSYLAHAQAAAEGRPKQP